MTAKQEYRYRKLNDLQREGVDVRLATDIRFNAGGASETAAHVTSKALASYHMAQAGWVVNGEVEIEDRGDVDVLCWGRKDYMSYAIEIESNPQAGIEGEYLEQYLKGTPIDELIIIDCTNLPNQLDEALGWVKEQLPV